jgi:hypothetical protein
MLKSLEEGNNAAVIADISTRTKRRTRSAYSSMLRLAA